MTRLASWFSTLNPNASRALTPCDAAGHLSRIGPSVGCVPADWHTSSTVVAFDTQQSQLEYSKSLPEVSRSRKHIQASTQQTLTSQQCNAGTISIHAVPPARRYNAAQISGLCTRKPKEPHRDTMDSIMHRATCDQYRIPGSGPLLCPVHTLRGSGNWTPVSSRW